MAKALRAVKRAVRAALLTAVILVVAAILVVYLAGVTIPRPMTPAGLPQNQALYLTMRDGVRLAVDVWLPAKLARGERVPAIMRATRYWRMAGASVWSRGLSRLFERWGGVGRGLSAAGYAVVLVDARGSGASFGNRPTEWSAAEVADYGQVIDWIARQPWSDGKVGATGVSYEANTAELAAVSGRPALRAVAPQYGDFDALVNLARPGGILNSGFLQVWSDANRQLDAGRLPLDPGPGAAVANLLVTGPKPVDADPSRRLLRQAIAGHRTLDVAKALRAAEFADDRLGTDTVQALSPAGRQAAIERSGVPMFVWAGWLDAATADGALSRYLTLRNPQRLVIGPWNHGGRFNADPFLPASAATNPPVRRQEQMLIAWFDRMLKEGKPPERGITYYTLGEGKWHSTPTWPPAGLQSKTWHLSAGGRLAHQTFGEWHGPNDPLSGAESYRVDFTATTGRHNRWQTQLRGDVIYPDRRQEDGKLLAYTTDPLPADTEITGTPVVDLWLTCDRTDGAIYAYLEDVAPDGRVTYITEGMLRLLHRRIGVAPPYRQLGPYHSYRRGDAAPVVPGKLTEARFGLYATSVLIRRGHRLRLAIAGHDASMFERYPPAGEVTLSISHRSTLSLPVKLRTGATDSPGREEP